MSLGSGRGGRRLAPRSILSLLLWLLVLGAHAAVPTNNGVRPIFFSHLNMSDGLPQATAVAILEDSQGYLWIGTEDGLIRYDGREMTRYSYSPRDRAGLPGNYVQQILEDAHHDLWLVIRGAGIAQWRRNSDNFRVYRHSPHQPGTIASDSVQSIAIDRQGRLWIGTSDSGIDSLDPTTERVTHHTHADGDPLSVRSNHVTALVRDSTDTLWVGTEAGLDRLNSDQQTFTHYQTNAIGPGVRIRYLLRDRSGSLWVATLGGGLIRLDPTGNADVVYRHHADDASSLASDEVRALLEDNDGQLWVGTADGLDLLDRRTGRFAHYRHDPREPSTLRESDVLSLDEGPDGILWVGTRNGGVSHWNRHAWLLGADRPDWLAGAGVTAFADGASGQIWVGSLGRGLYRREPDSGTWASIDTVVGRENALGDQNVMALRYDRHGALWIGTMSAGLKVLSANGSLRSIPVAPGDPHATSAPAIQTLYEADDGRFWIGTHGGGLNVLDPETGRIMQLPFDKDSVRGAVSDGVVSAIVQDQTGNFWVGTESGGLNLVDRNGHVQHVYRHDADDSSSIASNFIHALSVDSEGRVWVATDSGGLQQVLGISSSPETIHFLRVAVKENAVKDQIWGILEDSTGRFWMSGDGGLYHFDPRDHSVSVFDVEDGAHGEEFNSNAYHLLRDGRFCFGGPGGFNIFDPTKIPDHSEPPRVVLTAVAVMGRPVQKAMPYWRMDDIALDADASLVSLEFAALDYNATKRNRLSYRMAGLTDAWIDLGTQNRITLTNLEPGEHILEVRGATRNSGWTKTPLRLKIVRQPPLWRTKPAYALYALLSLALLAWAIGIQRRKAEDALAAKSKLEAEVAARTRDLQETNRELELAAKARSSILARMSHELRTPMNGVVGMTELLLRTQQTATQERLTRTIRSSADLLLHILNDLLDLSKAQADKTKLESLPLDLGMLLEESAALFAGAARAKNIELVVVPPLNPSRALLGDPLRIRQILLNLVGNAVKFTEYGEVTASADIARVDDSTSLLTITVIDTGIGMDADAISRAFEPFSQADESTTRRFGGTGLGLAICRELSRLMDGSISVESQPGRGSKFTVKLKLRSAALELISVTKPLLRGSVVVLSHSPTLVDSVSRHVVNFGLRRIVPSGGTQDMLTSAGALVYDASTHQPDLRDLLASEDPRLPSLVVIANAVDTASLGLASKLAPVQIVTKPVQRDALYNALRFATQEGKGRATVETTNSSNRALPVRGHVLVVEDDAVNAAVAQGYLEALGCTSVWVPSGSRALEQFSLESFDLVLMDLNMPDMDGFETTRRLRETAGESRRIPIVALTAHDRARFGAACIEAGIDDILTKPYTFDGCGAMLRRWLGPLADSAAAAPAVDDAAPRVEAARPPESAVDADLALVDESIVERLKSVQAKGAVSLYARLCDLFCSGSPIEIDKLGVAVALADFPAASAICHRLKSSSGNLGARAFSRAVAELEQICVDEDGPRAQELFARICAAHPALLAALSRNDVRAIA